MSPVAQEVYVVMGDLHAVAGSLARLSRLVIGILAVRG